MERHTVLIWSLSIITVLLAFVLIYELLVYNTGKKEPSAEVEVSDEAEPDEESTQTVTTDSSNSVYVTPPEASNPYATDSYRNGLKAAYKEIVEENEANYPNSAVSRYYVFDINSNGQPELITVEGMSEGDAMYHFYTYEKGNVVPIGTFGAGHSTLFGETSPSSGQLVNFYGHMGYELATYLDYTGDTISDRPAGTSYQTDEVYQVPYYYCNDFTGIENI